jgi:hypothetical protein
MKRVIPYWERGGDWSQKGLFIKRVDSKLPVEATEIPCTTLPCYAFLFLLEGEMLADINGEPFLCRGGQFLLIPANMPFPSIITPTSWAIRVVSSCLPCGTCPMVS